MLEPTIESLYYEFAPARIILRTHWNYAWVLKDHPLIWKTILDNYHNSVFGLPEHNIIIKSSLNGELEKEETIHCFCYHNIIERFKNIHGVSTFALASDIRPLRQTPTVSSYNFQENHKVVVQLRNTGDIRDFWGDGKPLDPATLNHLTEIGAVFIGHERLDNEQFRNQISGCDVFIGPDSSGLHLAYAAGVKRIVGYYSDRYPADTRAYPGMVTTRTPNELTLAIQQVLSESKYPDYLNKGNGIGFIRGKALTHCQGNGLDISVDLGRLADSVPILNKDYQFKAPLDFIFSSHHLELMENWQEQIALYENNLRDGGILFLYLPHPRMEYWTPGGLWVGAGHKWKPNPLLLAKYFNENTKLKVKEYSSHPDPYWSFYMILKKVK